MMRRKHKSRSALDAYMQKGGAKGRPKRLHMGVTSVKKGGLNTKGSARRRLKRGRVASTLGKLVR